MQILLKHGSVLKTLARSPQDFGKGLKLNHLCFHQPAFVGRGKPLVICLIELTPETALRSIYLFNLETGSSYVGKASSECMIFLPLPP